MSFVSFALHAWIMLEFWREFALYKWIKLSCAFYRLKLPEPLWEDLQTRNLFSDWYSLSSFGNHSSVLSANYNFFEGSRGHIPPSCICRTSINQSRCFSYTFVCFNTQYLELLSRKRTTNVFFYSSLLAFSFLSLHLYQNVCLCPIKCYFLLRKTALYHCMNLSAA